LAAGTERKAEGIALMEWLLAVVFGVMWAWAEARGVLAAQRADARETKLLDRIQAQSPRVLERVHANEMAQTRERERRPARESDTHYARVILPPGEETIAMARQTFEELVTTS